MTEKRRRKTVASQIPGVSVMETTTEKVRAWRAKNPDKSKAQRRAYYEKHREAIKQRSREWAAANRERKRKVGKLWAKKNADTVLNSRMKKFGLTASQYKALLAAQHNRCAICGTLTPKTRGRFSVDHCHKAEAEGVMKVRGLLCGKCNLGLGAFDDSPTILLAAIHYLERYS